MGRRGGTQKVVAPVDHTPMLVAMMQAQMEAQMNMQREMAERERLFQDNHRREQAQREQQIAAEQARKLAEEEAILELEQQEAARLKRLQDEALAATGRSLDPAQDITKPRVAQYLDGAYEEAVERQSLVNSILGGTRGVGGRLYA